MFLLTNPKDRRNWKAKKKKKKNMVYTELGHVFFTGDYGMTQC